ncbi:bifunctional aminotransferase class I/II-fold pyridoxal phosphate-dependent enzyme/GNAT family N-acetyltransferase [Flavivirga amylovorans]|uniref:Bifunctional aminotransferase class I/II-fold pyridoxal phosphate-dependent enzyme/GNAT family N-acetyltransferase n=1 Tax=Flavivirga amylovorans TaxID=870486 RepID=A0ABT8X6M2_9FLAO|nr:bifunctional aminotransferase class I/II-fold pyridoxal phosphate-dependent enzyme/GNAT family N-acetyltransferase [Flavivirga amylovorans]MDO5989549.1 bifunctional aminotransferase class I/II-fold pyridoxal phosphate-dependent enzyme/GNAT family N-acetyltransferase [Flavivirga amylovorans]
MAKIKHNNFLDTVNEVFTDAKEQGVLHLYAEGDSFTGRKIRIKQKDLFHFGTTGYLGLEQDERLKKAAMDAVYKYGTQFPLSKSYISNPLYAGLEEKITQLYDAPIIITKNSTLGHLGVIPSAVEDGDAIILDHQVHWSVQSAANVLKTRSVPIEMIRHSNLDMLEDKIKKLSSKYKKIWYMADGVYSMYGDVAPLDELMELCNKYPQLHLYLDDVHGMSWAGKNGTGYVLSKLDELPDNVLLFGTLSKTFGASGAVAVCTHKKRYHKIKTFGGPLTFSAQLEPASVAAAIASADIHLSPEIYMLQNELLERITLFNTLLSKTDLPLVEENNSPVFYIGTGMPVTGYNFVNRLMKEGFFVNLGIFPAVPVKNTGIRVTISRHNQAEEIKSLVDAMVYHYPKALEDTHTTSDKVRRAFKLPTLDETPKKKVHEEFRVVYEKTIQDVDMGEWNKLMGGKGVFDWDGLLFLENVFTKNKLSENNWDFHYIIIRDENNTPILATFFTYALWKEDMLAPVSVSLKLEETRKNDPYYLTSQVLGMGSPFTEGEHIYLDKSHPDWKLAMKQMLDKIEELELKFNSNWVVLRDFENDDELSQLFHQQGFIKTVMPDSCQILDLHWKTIDEYPESLSTRSRKHFKKDIQPYEKHFKVSYSEASSEKLIDQFYELYTNVNKHNLALNMFPLPRKLFTMMSQHPNWEFIAIYLKEEFNEGKSHIPVGVMFCYKNLGVTYTPAFIGMDYNYTEKHQVYRQLLYQTIKRATRLGFKKIDFGMTASFEKKKVGATIIPKVAYIQAKDNYSMELMGVMENN